MMIGPGEPGDAHTAEEKVEKRALIKRPRFTGGSSAIWTERRRDDERPRLAAGGGPGKPFSGGSRIWPIPRASTSVWGSLLFQRRGPSWTAFPAGSAAGLSVIRPTPGFRSSGPDRGSAGPDVDPGRLRHRRFEEALFLALSVLVDPGGEVPGSRSRISHLRPDRPALGRPSRLLSVGREDGFVLKASRIKPLLSEKTKAVILNSPANPTGAVHPRTGSNNGGLLAERGILPVSDEVYRELYWRPPPGIDRTWMPDAIVVDSLSKSCAMTGWRLGWCVVPSALAPAVTAIHQMAVMCAPVPSQRAAILVFDGAADQERKKTWPSSAAAATQRQDPTKPPGPSLHRAGRRFLYLFGCLLVAGGPGRIPGYRPRPGRSDEVVTIPGIFRSGRGGDSSGCRLPGRRRTSPRASAGSPPSGA